MQQPSYISGDDYRVAYLADQGRTPTVVFLGGFNSHMRGTKAEALARHCRDAGHAYVRFDYSGHGESDGRFEDATIGAWRTQALAVVDRVTRGPLVLVGSSMGAWIMLLAAAARPRRTAALIGVAAAVDMTERLLRPGLSAAQRAQLQATGMTRIPSAYDPAGYIVTEALLSEGREHLLLGAGVPTDAPLRLLHGTADSDVPWQLSVELMERVAGADVRLHLVKGADHRFSEPQHLQLLMNTLDEFLG